MNADPTAVGTNVVELARAERFADMVRLFAPALRETVSPEAVRTAWCVEVGKNGPVSEVGAPTAEPAESGLTRLSVPVRCERGAFSVVMSVDATGAVHGLRLAAANASWTPPPYARPDTFVEHDVVLDGSTRPVPGTLTLPRGPGRHPGVVLLSGGGPFDRDETIGPNKPLKDLAWGLASRGIAVVRFDKVTHVHAQELADFTIVDEYLPHCLAAVRLLRGQDTVDADRVFLLGHSAGGKVAPRIAAADDAVAGLVILAGDAAPMHEAAVRVARHLATAGFATEATVADITRQAARIADPRLSPDTPTAELLFGLPASYWLDLRDYDPVATAAALTTPMLVLQGDRDYQVTADDDLARWQAGLADRRDVTIRVHAGANHLFFAGTRPSTPAEYDRPQHVDSAVVTAVADWLTSS